ncbi:MAG: hypothetical protein HY690_17330 [Chloroflexi bacterium]|nr:hypothetical protein [Chloroflexota bacterium]
MASSPSGRAARRARSAGVMLRKSPMPPAFTTTTRAVGPRLESTLTPRAGQEAYLAPSLLERGRTRSGIGQQSAASGHVILDFGFWILDWGGPPSRLLCHRPLDQPNPKSKIQNPKFGGRDG